MNRFENLDNRILTLEEVKEFYVHSILDLCNGNKSKTARILRISRSTLRDIVKTDKTSDIKRAKRYAYKRRVKEYCYFCKTNENIFRHHIIPKKNGGTDDPDNFISICVGCHNKLHATIYTKLIGSNPVGKNNNKNNNLIA